jgi:flagellar biosynthesis/type III secretory pathway M-ring protein FliF/YscJ
MNAFSAIGKQISDLVMSMTPAARIMAGLMSAVVVVSLGWITVGGGATSKQEYLFGGRDFSDAELSSWEAAFGDAQLGTYERVGQRIKVPSAQKDLYLKALSTANALPRNFNSYMDSALSNGSPFDPNSLIDKRAVLAREQRLAHMIEGLSGIEQAFVNYDEQRAGFGRKTDRVCSIAVRGRSGYAIPANQLRSIAKLATNSFAGLTEDNVTVSDLNNPNSVFRGNSDPNAPEDNPYFTAQNLWEEYYEKNLNELLDSYEAKIAVNVVLDPRLVSQSEQIEYRQPMTVQTSSVSRNSENAKAAPGGQPGASPNGVSNQATSLSVDAAGQSSKTKETQENEKKVAGHQATVEKTAGLVPKSVSVSIGIPESHYRKIAKHRFLVNNPDKTENDAPAPTEGELATIKADEERAVRAAVATIPVGIQAGDDRKAYIEVYSFTDLPVPEIPGPSLADTSLAWMGQYWSTVALLGLVLVSLLMMFSWVKAPASQSSAEKRFSEGFGLQVPETPVDSLELSDEAQADGSSRKKPAALELTGQDLKEDLSMIIKGNPDAAVNLIKTWIGEAA